MTSSTPQWSIGIYQGDTPFSLQPVDNNPVIQAQDITDIPAQFIADPFMIQYCGEWFLFFETLPFKTASFKTLSVTPDPKSVNQYAKGVIGLAKSSDGINWHYQGTVLKEPFHLSYPYVFEFNGEYYMLPETLDADCIRLYKATDFPTKWTPVSDLLLGRHADASLFYHQNMWWMFSCATPEQHDSLELHYSETLEGSWESHPLNPIINKDDRTARPAGRVIQWEGKLFRFAQDCFPRYGSQVRVFEIITLSVQHYQEIECRQSPLLRPTGKGWNGRNMHHIDLHQLDSGQWRACVDGYHLDQKNSPKNRS